MNRVRRSALTPSILRSIRTIAAEKDQDYEDVLVRLIGGVSRDAITDQLRYHYLDLAETVLAGGGKNETR